MKDLKKILLVSSSFYPELSPRSFRATELAKEFSRQGHFVKVITKYRKFDYSSFLKQYPFIKLLKWRNNHVGGISKSKSFSRLNKIFTRLFGILFEYPAIKEMFLVNKILHSENGYDLVISFAVPHPIHWGVARARTRRNRIAKVWIADCGDPYMFARLDRFRKPFYFSYFEKNFCRKCDYLAVPFREMKNQFYPEFKSKITIIPQGFNFDEIIVYQGIPVNNKPIFVFAGSIIPGKRDLKLLLDFLCSLDLDFQFIVFTNNIEWFNHYREKLHERIAIRKYIDRIQLIYEMSKADFLINVDTSYDDQTNVEAVPSKLIDYALANRPILNINSAYLDEAIVLEFLNGNYTNRRIVDKSIYDIRRVSSQFLELCK